MTFYIIQAIGIAAFLIGLISYQFKKQRNMYIARVSADAIWTFHYFLLGAIPATMTLLVSTLRTLLVVFLVPEKYKNIIVSSSIAIACCLCVYFAENNTTDLLPIIAAILFGVSTYYHQDYFKSRMLMVFGCATWLIIGIVCGSYAEMISSSFAIISVLIGFYRHHYKSKTETEKIAA